MLRIVLKKSYFVRASSSLAKEILRRAENLEKNKLLKEKRSSFLYDANSQIDNIVDAEVFQEVESIAAVNLLKFVY